MTILDFEALLTKYGELSYSCGASGPSDTESSRQASDTNKTAMGGELMSETVKCDWCGGHLAYPQPAAVNFEADEIAELEHVRQKMLETVWKHRLTESQKEVAALKTELQESQWLTKRSVEELAVEVDAVKQWRELYEGAVEEMNARGLNLQESGRELAAAYERIEKYETSEALVWAKYREMEKAHDHEFKNVTALLNEQRNLKGQIATLQARLEATSLKAEESEMAFQFAHKELDETQLVLNGRIEKLTVQLAMAHELALKAARQIEEIK